MNVASAGSLLLLAVACAAAGCDQAASPRSAASSQPSGLPTTKMNLGGKTFTIEIARTDKTREHGLMDRDSMPADHGMIFVFKDEQPRAFWMRNTRIPLDIVFISADGQIVSVHSMKPFDLSSTRSAGPAKYAIELNEGVAAAQNLKPGDKLEIPADARDAQE
jgi:uncharacterized membrane protein (UPF0127 family)